MKKLIGIFLMLEASMASAQFSSADQIKSYCQKLTPGESAEVILQQEFCVRDQKLKLLGGAVNQKVLELERRIEQMRAEQERAKNPLPPSILEVSEKTREETQVLLERMAEQIRAQQGTESESIQPPAVATPVSSFSSAVSSLAPPNPMPVPAFGGLAYRVVQTPGQYAATTFDVSGPRDKIEHLASGADRWKRGATDVRVIVRKNGKFIPIAHVDGTFETLYADIDGNGKPDSVPYSAVDPLAIDDLYVAHIGPHDRIELIWLNPTGKSVLIPGAHSQVLWGFPKRVRYDPVPVLGRFKVNAENAWPLN